MVQKTNAGEKDAIIARAEFFSVKIPIRPHVAAEEGGHLFIETNNPEIEDRTQLNGDAAIELMWLTMIVGEAMEEVLRRRGLDIYRINYQDNGNWSFLRGEKPKLHVHLYGRTRNETYQEFGQALVFPDPHDEIYNDFSPIDKETGCLIGLAMAKLAESEKYAWFTPSSLSFPKHNGDLEK